MTKRYELLTRGHGGAWASTYYRTFREAMNAAHANGLGAAGNDIIDTLNPYVEPSVDREVEAAISYP